MSHLTLICYHAECQKSIKINFHVVLTEERISRLNDIGMVWGDKLDLQWEKSYQEARQFYEQHGHLRPPTQYRTASGMILDSWLNHQRNSTRMTQERRDKLDAVGMVWEKEDRWEKQYNLAKAFFEENGHLNIHQGYVVDGVWLGKWLYSQVRAYRNEARGGKLPKEGEFSKERALLLKEIGMELSTKIERAWDEQFCEARKYFEANGDMRVPVNYITQSGKQLYIWLNNLRKQYRKGLLEEWKIRDLDSLQMDWHDPDQNERKGVTRKSGNNPLSAQPDSL